MRSDECSFSECFAGAVVAGFVRRRCASGQVFDHSYRETKMTIAAAIGYALSAFGIGYAAGSVQRIIRRSIEVLD